LAFFEVVRPPWGRRRVRGRGQHGAPGARRARTNGVDAGPARRMMAVAVAPMVPVSGGGDVFRCGGSRSGSGLVERAAVVWLPGHSSATTR
jgi:hypothetical protein